MQQESQIKHHEIQVTHSNNRFRFLIKKTLKVLTTLVGIYFITKFFSKLSMIHGTQLPDSYFSSEQPSILGLLNSEIFMGIIFFITLAVIVYVIYLLWVLHEIAVHKAQAVASRQIELVFALSLAGLFINKTWWVLALVIAFTRWDIIADSLSKIIQRGVAGERK